MKKSYKFWLKPTKKQAKLLLHILDECRWLYNQCLDHKKLAYEELDLSLSKYDQLMLLPILKEERLSLCDVHSQVLQDVIIRLHKAFDGFFRRVKAGEKPGFPRFRSASRFDSFTYPQTGFDVEGSLVKLSKIGSIPIKLHRPIVGVVKTCTIRRKASGTWEVSFSCEQEANILPENDKSVGIDVGIENWATFSDGKVIQNPRFFKVEEKALAKAQRKLSKLEKGTRVRNKQKKIVAQIHERVRNKRTDFCHKISRSVINTYQNICVEELAIQQMCEGSPLGHRMAQSIADASWGQFARFLTYKAEDAGRKIGFVRAAYTSQDCSKCGHRERKKLSERIHCCSHCGYTVHRDFNASENILAIGLDGLGVSPRSPRL